jgi:diguanylate cyclase
MFEELDPQYAAAIADRADDLMARHQIPRTPANFAVWFSYSRGDLPELRQVIDILIAGKKRFDSTTCTELFSKYVSSALPGGAARDAPEKLKTAMAEATRYVEQAIVENRTQIQAIGNVAGKAKTALIRFLSCTA